MIINNKTYKMPQLDFNAMCSLEDMGVSLVEMDKKPMAMIRGFIALAIGDVDKAGAELSEHIRNGGQLDDILKEITTAINESGFFQALSASAKAGNPKSPAQKGKSSAQSKK